MRPLITILLFGVLPLAGCNAPKAHNDVAPVHSEHSDSASATTSHGAEHHAATAVAVAHAAAAPTAHGGGVATASLPVPFVGESGSLDVAKGFMRTALKDNEAFVASNPAAHFQPFLTGQKPRATVIACSDSRVQSNAFDKSPENDLFTIRNIGNQFKTAEGSVMYGVEHLETSVLLIVGHTGCGAIKAALADHSKLEEPIKNEVDHIAVPKREPGINESEMLTRAVLSNVHDQVHAALAKFGDRVKEGKLVIVGAVYDFRNDLEKGYGRLLVVDVNGNTEAGVLASFTKAVEK